MTGKPSIPMTLPFAPLLEGPLERGDFDRRDAGHASPVATGAG